MTVVNYIKAEGKSSLREIADELNLREVAPHKAKKWTAKNLEQMIRKVKSEYRTD